MRSVPFQRACWQHVTEQGCNINNKILLCFLYCSLFLIFLAACCKRWVSGLLALVHTLSFSLAVSLCLLTGVRRILNIEATRQLASAISKHWFSISLNQLSSRKVILLNIYQFLPLQAFFKIIKKRDYPSTWRIQLAVIFQKWWLARMAPAMERRKKIAFYRTPLF